MPSILVMQYALVNDSKTTALPKTRGVCVFCSDQVQSKCGKIKIWHWSHKAERNCDEWFEPETEWHRNWKLNFEKENTEVIIKKGEKRHIADVYTKQGIVIELQNSPIDVETIKAREIFYGERMLWIINGHKFKDRFKTFQGNREFTFKVDESYGRRDLPSFLFKAYTRMSVYWIINLNSQHVPEEFSSLIIKNNFDYDLLRKYYFKPTVYNELDLTNEFINALKALAKDHLYLKNHYCLRRFEWLNTRSSWKDAMRPVFIDFGEDHLWYILEGMGQPRGICNLVEKSVFLKKYKV